MKDLRFDMAESGESRDPDLPPPPPIFRATDLTKGGKRAHIVHGDQVYTLSITRAGKLILTK